MVVGGGELGVLVGSGWGGSLDIAKGGVCWGSGSAELLSLFPVVDIDATTHDALFAQKVLQEIVLDWGSCNYGCCIRSRTTNTSTNAIDSSSGGVLEISNTGTIWLLFFDWVELWVADENVCIAVDFASILEQSENNSCTSCSTSSKSASDAIDLNRDGLAGHLSQIQLKGVISIGANGVDGLATLLSDVGDGDGSVLAGGGVPAGGDSGGVHGVGVSLVVRLVVLVLLGSVLVSRVGGLTVLLAVVVGIDTNGDECGGNKGDVLHECCILFY